MRQRIEKSLKYVMHYADENEQDKYVKTLKEAMVKHNYSGGFEGILNRTSFKKAIRALCEINSVEEERDVLEKIRDYDRSLTMNTWKKMMMDSYDSFKEKLYLAYEEHMYKKSLFGKKVG